MPTVCFYPQKVLLQESLGSMLPIMNILYCQARKRWHWVMTQNTNTFDHHNTEAVVCNLSSNVYRNHAFGNNIYSFLSMILTYSSLGRDISFFFFCFCVPITLEIVHTCVSLQILKVMKCEGQPHILNIYKLYLSLTPMIPKVFHVWQSYLFCIMSINFYCNS